MNNKKQLLETRTITLIGIMTAVIIVMSVVPFLGYIPLGFIDATILHVPVIIVAIVEGPVAGGILGFMFGMTSFIKAFVTPNATAFIFMNPIVSVIPRILIGVLTGYVFLALRGNKNKAVNKLAITISAAIGSLTNSFLVLGLIYLIYAKGFLEATKAEANVSAIKAIGAIFLTSGMGEMIASMLIATPICYVLLKIFKRGK